MTDFVSVLTDIYQQRLFDLLWLGLHYKIQSLYFIAARVHLNKPVVLCWFFYIKITLCHYSNWKVSFSPVFQGRDIIIIMKCHNFIVKGDYIDNPSKAEAPVCIMTDISPGQNKFLLHSRWFVGTLRMLFFLKKEWGIFILERIWNGLTWKHFSWLV